MIVRCHFINQKNYKMKTTLHFQKQQILILIIFCLYLFTSNTLVAQTWIQLGSDITGPTGNGFGSAVSISADGNTTAYGLPSGGPSTGNRVQVFSYNGTSWTQKGNTIVSSSRGGESISLNADGTIICIGAPLSGMAGTNAGIIQVYAFDGTTWQQRGANILGTAIGDAFGSKVVISSDGNTIGASAIYEDNNGESDIGSVRIYTYNGTNWIQKGATIFGSGINALGRILEMDASGNTIITGRFNGLNRVLTYNGSDWIQKGQNLIATSPENIVSATISGDANTIAYGTQNTSKTGQVRIFSFNGSEWIQLGSTLNTGETGGAFGNTINLSNNGSILAIGAHEINSTVQKVGAVYVYQSDGTDWNQVGQTVMGNNIFDQVGSALDLSADGNTYVVAERPDQGTAYVYRADPLLMLEEKTINNMNLFPNPSNGSFTLDLGGHFKTIQIKVSNLLGQSVLSKSFNNIQRIENLEIDNPGIYLVTVSDMENVSQTLRLIIN